MEREQYRMWLVGKSIKIFMVQIIICILLSQFFLIFAAYPPYLKDDELVEFGITTYEDINPNLLVYPLKRISEEIKLKLLFRREQKQQYIYSLYDKRLRELVYIVNSRKEGFLFFTADRYNSFVGRIKKDYPLSVDLRINFLVHIKLLERLRDIYPAGSPNWEKLQQTMDTTKSLI